MSNGLVDCGGIHFGHRKYARDAIVFLYCGRYNITVLTFNVTRDLFIEW